MMALFLVLVFSILSVTAQTTPSEIPVPPTISLSFLNSNHEPVPGVAALAVTAQSNCVAIPILTTGFESSVNNSVFAVYLDSSCQSYLYSVTGLLANVHGAQSLMWTESDLAGLHRIGETFTNPLLSHGKTEQERKASLLRIIIVSVGGTVFLLMVVLYLWYIDNKKNKARGGFVPEPCSPGGGGGERGMAESSLSKDNGKGVLYGYHRKNESTASSISYLPPYGGEDNSNSATPKTASPRQNQSQGGGGGSEKKQQGRLYPTMSINSSATHHEGGMTKSGSFSLLSYKVGTGVGLDPESPSQGRNAGFGLGYDLEENKARDTRRDSDIMMRDAMMTPPHSPNMRPYSMASEDGRYLGRHSLSASILRETYSDLRCIFVAEVECLYHVSGTTSSCRPMLPKHTDDEYKMQGIHDPTPKKSALGENEEEAIASAANKDDDDDDREDTVEDKDEAEALDIPRERHGPVPVGLEDEGIWRRGDVDDDDDNDDDDVDDDAMAEDDAVTFIVASESCAKGVEIEDVCNAASLL
ncbi:hypothetical protein BG004_007381 [Podila humilis]|nr:hypothetical protein BG004_007381 [Podila humilis]